MASFTAKICEWFHLADGTTSLLDESDGETDPAPQKDEKEEDSGEEAGEQDCEEKPGVSQSHQILEEVGSPVHLLRTCLTIGQKQVLNFVQYQRTWKKFLDTLGSVEEIAADSLSPE